MASATSGCSRTGYSRVPMGNTTRITLRYSEPQAHMLAYWQDKYGFTKTDAVRQFLIRGLAEPPSEAPLVSRDQSDMAYIRLSNDLLERVDALAVHWGKCRPFTLRALLWHASAPVRSEILLA